MLAVVLRHLAETAEKGHMQVPYFTSAIFGRWGVDLFFVISGFVMMFITARHSGTWADTVQFWARRVVRIAPLYWLITSLVVGIALVKPGMTDYKPMLDNIVASYLFIPWADARGIFPPLRVGWSLNFEMYFYLVFGLLILLPRRAVMPALLVWAAISVAAGLLLVPTGPIPWMLTHSMLAEFAGGAVVGWLWLRRSVLPVSAALAGFIGGALVLVLDDVLDNTEIDAIRYGAPSVFMVAGAVALETRGLMSFRSPTFLAIGDASYSIYLTHVLVLGLFSKAAVPLMTRMGLSPITMVVFDVVVTLLAGYAVYKVLEMPMHDWMLARLFGKRPKPVPAGATPQQG